MKMNAEEITALAEEAGFFESGWLEIGALAYEQEIRTLCEGNMCRCYNTTWACPPAVGTLDECRERVNRYAHMLLFSNKYPLKSSFDLKGMMAAMKEFKDLTDRFHALLLPRLEDFMLLGNESCGRCAKCTWPNEPCRFPDRLHHSIEGYGFNVTKLAKKAGLRYNNGPNTVTYFGALLYND